MLMEPRGIDAVGTAIESEPTNEWLSAVWILAELVLWWDQASLAGASQLELSSRLLARIL